MNKLRKFLVIGVMVMTVFATMGMVAPSVEAAASAGDLIKMDGLSSVYYLGADGKRYVFPNTETYMSWYSDFSGVVTIPASELQSYPLGGNVVMRPGTKLVKITTDPTVYAVEPNGTLRSIVSEANAIALFGTNWNKRIVDVPDAFFTNYTIAAPLSVGQIPAGSLVKSADSADVYYYDGTNYRAIASEAAFNANRFQFSNVLTVSNSVTAGGNAIATAELVNVAQGGTPVGPVVTGSGLMVSLNAATPISASVPNNGVTIPMAKVNLTAANDGAVTVNSITVQRIGLSSYDQIDRVWAEHNGVIVASKKSMNSNNESILTFSPALTISAGQTVALDILATLAGASGNIGLSIASASAVSATAASVSGSFPINGNLMSPTTYNVTELTVASSFATSTAYVGDEELEIGQFDVNFTKYSKDVVLKSLMLRNLGNEELSNVLMNIYLENNGNKVATGVVSGKYVTFNFANGGFDMLRDDGNQTFNIVADVIAKETTNTADSIILSMNKAEDLVANEVANGFGVIVKNTAALTVGAADIASSAVSVSKKSTSPSDFNVIKGAKDQVALLANLKADEAITAEGLYLNLDQHATTSFENIQVFLNGVLLDSFDEADSGATGKVTIDSAVYLKKGDNEIKVTVNVKTTASTTASNKFQVTLNKSGVGLLDMPEYELSRNSVSVSTINGSATGAIVTVTGAVFDATENSGYSNKSVVTGSKDISFGKFAVKATNDNLKITRINVTATSSATASSSDLYDMKIYVDGNQVGNTKAYTSTGVSFSPLSVTLADNQTRSIELKGSFDSSATTTDHITFQLAFTVTDSNGKTVDTASVTPVTKKFSVIDKGTLTIAKDGDSPVGGILASKAGVEQTVAQFKLTTANDSADVTELVMVSATSTPGATSSISTTDPRISSYKLYVEGNSTAIDTVTPFAGEAKFVINNSSVVVPADGSKKLTVKAVLNDINNDETATDAFLKLQINSVKFKSSNGEETATTLATPVAANEFRIRKTAPTIALLALPSSQLNSGSQVVSKFTVTADANADVKVARLAAKFTATASTSLVGTPSVKVNGVSKTTGVTPSYSVATGTGYIYIDFGTSTPEIVAAGTSKTFEIVSNVLVEGSNRESLSTVIEEAAYAAGGSAVVSQSFTWSDSASNTDSKNYWFNSWRVNGLPSDTQTLSIN